LNKVIIQPTFISIYIIQLACCEKSLVTHELKHKSIENKHCECCLIYNKELKAYGMIFQFFKYFSCNLQYSAYHFDENC